MDVEILEEAPGVVLAFHCQPEAAAHTRVDAVGGNQIPAANELFLITSIGMRHPGRDAAAILGEILKRRVVLDAAAEA